MMLINMPLETGWLPGANTASELPALDYLAKP